MRVIRILVLFLTISSIARAQGEFSKEQTPPNWPLTFEKIASPFGERILSVACTSDGVIFAGTEGNGILRSTDGGESWQSTSLRKGNIWPIHVAPGGTIIAFRTEGWMSRRAVLRSSDGGASWNELPAGDAGHFGMAILKSYGSKMYSEGGGGLHMSTDDGLSWATLISEAPMAPCCSDYRLEVLSDSVLFALSYRGLFRSGDGGLSWGRIPTRHRYYSQLLRDPAGGVLVAAVDSSSVNAPDELIRVSYDGSVVQTIGSGPFYGSIPVGILLDNGDLLAAAVERNETIMRSADSGRTWVSSSGIRAAVSDFCQCPDGTVLAATHGGLYRSDDRGRTWEDCAAGSTRRRVTHLFNDGHNTIYAGTGDAGLFLSRDECRTWTHAGTGYCGIVDGFSVAEGHALIAVEHTQPYLVYSVYGVEFIDWWGWAYTLDLSWNGTQTWRQLDFYANSVARGRDSLVLTDDRAQNISTDGGDSWTSESMLAGVKDIQAMQGGIFVLRNDTLLFRKDGQTEWEFVTAAVNGRAIGGNDFHLLLLEVGRLRHSSDHGETWTSLPVDDIFFHHSPRIVWLDNAHSFAVTGIGDVMLLSSDMGTSWKRIVPEADTRRFIYCAYTDSEGRLLLGTDDGLYRSTMGLRGSTVPNTFHLGVPYPNPATSPVMIPYTLEEPGYVRLTIHDISGRERGVLHEGVHGTGTFYQGLHHTHSYLYGGAGLYFINLSVNGQMQSQPLVFPE